MVAGAAVRGQLLRRAGGAGAGAGPAPAKRLFVSGCSWLGVYHAGALEALAKAVRPAR